MSGDVLDIVARVMARPWAWGQADCWCAACDVFAAVHGFDPMAAHRGRYAGRAGAARIVREAGGMVALAAGTFEAAGLVRGLRSRAALALTEAGMAQGMGRRALCVHVGEGVFAGKTAEGFGLTGRVEEVWGCPS